jgi:hypothetical protein
MKILIAIKYYLISLYIRFKGRPAALKKAIRKAKRLCKRKKKRYRVYFIEMKYQVLNRRQVQWKKHTGEWNRNVNVTKLEPLCFYDTLEGLQPEGEKLLATNN